MAVFLNIVPYRFLPATSGGEKCILSFQQMLSAHHRVFVVGVQENQSQEDLSFRLFPVFGSGAIRYFPWTHFRAVKRIAREVRPHVVGCEHHYMFPMVAMVARALRCSTFIRSHNIESERFRSVGKVWWPLMRIFEGWAYRQADRVFFLTPEDARWAEHHYRLDPRRIHVVPFVLDRPTKIMNRKDVRESVAAMFNLDIDIPWLYFMGKLNYEPNEEAVLLLIQEIFPLLKKEIGDFQLLIFGAGLRNGIRERIEDLADEQIQYLGFVPDLDKLLSSVDIMLNPVLSGGGVKIKVLESLSWNNGVVSTESGALGVARLVCGRMLRTVEDHDWHSFVGAVKEMISEQPRITEEFYQYYGCMGVYERLHPEIEELVHSKS